MAYGENIGFRYRLRQVRVIESSRLLQIQAGTGSVCLPTITTDHCIEQSGVADVAVGGVAAPALIKTGGWTPQFWAQVSVKKNYQC